MTGTDPASKDDRSASSISCSGEAGDKRGSDKTSPCSSSPSSSPSRLVRPNDDRSPPSSPSPSSSTSSSSTNCKTCAGITVYSRAHHDQGRPPSCIGLSRRRQLGVRSGSGGGRDDDGGGSEPFAVLPPDVAPGGEFKFLCLGYSVCRDEAWASSKEREKTRKEGEAEDKGAAEGKQRDRGGVASTSSSAPAAVDDDDVELPACLGVQIIRAAASTPVAMPTRGVGASGGESEGERASDGAKQQRQDKRPHAAASARRAPLNNSSPSASSPELPSMRDMVDRFNKSAQRVATRMASNVISVFGGDR